MGQRMITYLFQVEHSSLLALSNTSQLKLLGQILAHYMESPESELQV